MEKTEEVDWKRYYHHERTDRLDEIRLRIDEFRSAEDPEVDEILGSGGALSFPHTHLDHSLIPVVRTVMGIIRGKFDRVIALGVLHRTSEWRTEDEFSLDGFRDILDIAVDMEGIEKPELKEIYLPRNREYMHDIDETVTDLTGIGREVSSRMEDRTALVMTGDLVHYGHGYGTSDPSDDPGGMISRWIVEGLDRVYVDKDYRSFLEWSRKRMSDQGAVAVTASSILGSDLDHRIISSEIADYTAILRTASPTVVASVFYGVIKRR